MASIEYYLGGDWKFLAAVTGNDAASSTYAYIWCKCKCDERWDTTKEWSVSDATRGAQSTEENLEISALPKSRKQFNVSNPPLFPTIPLSHIVIDNLHLFLCVADVLINLLITELRCQDVIDQQKRFNGQFDISKFKHIAAYGDSRVLILRRSNIRTTQVSITNWSGKVVKTVWGHRRQIPGRAEFQNSTSVE